MVYSKEVVIKQLQYKYKITHLQAKSIYQAYKNSGDIKTLEYLLFPNKNYEEENVNV